MLQSMRSSAKYIWIFLIVFFVGGFLLAETSGLLGITRFSVFVGKWREIAARIFVEFLP